MMQCEYIEKARAETSMFSPVVTLAYLSSERGKYAALDLAPMFPCLAQRNANAWITRVSKDAGHQIERFFVTHPSPGHLSRRAMLDFCDKIVYIVKERCFARVPIRRNQIVGILGGTYLDSRSYFETHLLPGACPTSDACEENMWIYEFNTESLLLLPQDQRRLARDMGCIAVLPTHEGNQLQFVSSSPSPNVRVLPIFHYGVPFFFYMASEDIRPGGELFVDHGFARRKSGTKKKEKPEVHDEKKEEEEEECSDLMDTDASSYAIPVRSVSFCDMNDDVSAAARILRSFQPPDNEEGFDKLFADLLEEENPEANRDFGVSRPSSPQQQTVPAFPSSTVSLWPLDSEPSYADLKDHAESVSKAVAELLAYQQALKAYMKSLGL